MLSSSEENQQLILDHISKTHLLETTRWSKFIAIVSLIFIGLGLIMAISMMALSGNTAVMEQAAVNGAQLQMLSRLGMIGLGIIYLVILALYFYPVYCLIKFSNHIKNAIRHNDPVLLASGLRYQKNMFIFLGIITIIVVAFYALMFLIGGVGMLAGSMAAS